MDEFWKNIKAGEVGIGPITKFDATNFKVHIAAEVKGFEAKKLMDAKAARRMEPFSQYAVVAAAEAFADSGLDMSKEDPFRAGVSIGSGIGSLQVVEKEYMKIVEKGPSRVSPMMVPMMISNMASGNVSINLGLRGIGTYEGTGIATKTDENGEFLFTNVTSGEYRVVEAYGYNSEEAYSGDWSKATIISATPCDPSVENISQAPSEATRIMSLTPNTVYVTVDRKSVV